IVHLLNARDAIKLNAGIEQSLEIHLVRVLAQEKNVLTHDESPDSMIDRRVVVVTLIDRELQKMFGCCGDRRIIQTDTTGCFHRHPPLLRKIWLVCEPGKSDSVFCSGGL